MQRDSEGVVFSERSHEFAHLAAGGNLRSQCALLARRLVKQNGEHCSLPTAVFATAPRDTAEVFRLSSAAPSRGDEVARLDHDLPLEMTRKSAPELVLQTLAESLHAKYFRLLSSQRVLRVKLFANLICSSFSEV